MSLRKLIAVMLVLLLTSCSISTINTIENQSGETSTISAEETVGPSVTPSATEPPLAARVNGEGIWMDEFRASLTQYQAAQEQLGTHYSEQAAKQVVLNDLVGQTLLAQAASTEGYVVDDAALQARVDSLASSMGGDEALNTWMVANGYTDVVFRHALQRSMAATWETDKILANVPTTAPQVHAREILVLDEGLANQIYRQLQAGADFTTLAYQYDPTTGGDLGWFPRGYLTQPAIEEAAFSLGIGQYSTVIHTDFGYQIIYVIETDPNRPLSSEALNLFQHLALQQWIDQHTAASMIENYLP
jgi:peptidyl-prolyl cis-trans isomerase C